MCSWIIGSAVKIGEANWTLCGNKDGLRFNGTFVFFLRHDRSLYRLCQTRLLLVVVDAGHISTLLSSLSKVVSAGSATCVTHSTKVQDTWTPQEMNSHCIHRYLDGIDLTLLSCAIFDSAVVVRL